ncbi:MAG: hypothetical protein R3C49_03560 [Planctomycetaceae bacterium]
MEALIAEQAVQAWQQLDGDQNSATVWPLTREVCPEGHPLPSVSLSLPRLPLSDFQQILGCRLLVWPGGIENRLRIAVVSSRLKRRRDQLAWWFDSLRTITVRSCAETECLCVVDGTAAAEATSRTSELFGMPRLKISVSPESVTSPAELTQWLQCMRQRVADWRPECEFQSEVWLSPRYLLTVDEAPAVSGGDAALILFGERIVSLYCRGSGNIVRELNRQLNPQEPTCRRHRPILLVTIAANSPAPPETLTELQPVDWRLDGGPETCHTELAQAAPLGSKSPPAVVSEASPDLIIAPQDWLLHWTRPSPGPWPGQPREDFLDELILGCPGADRSALACLLRMLHQQRILATTVARNAQPTVSFTDVPLTEFRQRRVFRSHRQRYDFEPWGIAIQREAAIRLGAEPVRYVESEISSEDDQVRPEFLQRRFDASGKIDWSEEREWRVVGDVDLAALPLSRIRVFVDSPPEAALIRSLFPIQAIPVPIENRASGGQ